MESDSLDRGMNSLQQDTSATGPGLLSVGIEEGADGAALAHGLGLPGCVGRGESVQEALESFAESLADWLDFRAVAGLPVPPREQELEVTVDEWVASAADVSRGETEVCFEADLRPLADGEINEGLHLLGDLRGQLLRGVKRIPRGELDREPHTPGDPLSLRRILDELARAEWWTLSRLGASPLAEVPAATLGRLDTAMALVVQQFTGFAREQREMVIELEGEVWTPRKVMRRLLWLEWSLGRAALSVLPDGTSV